MNLKTAVTRKQHAESFEKQTFPTPDTHTCVCISEGKKYLFFEEIGVVFVLVTPVLRFALLPFYDVKETKKTFNLCSIFGYCIMLIKLNKGVLLLLLKE